MAGLAARPALSGPGYESWYVRAVDPAARRGVWLRHTVHTEAGEPPAGQVWATLFAEDVTAHKAARPVDGLPLGADGVAGHAGPLTYDLRWTGADAPLRHLPAGWMYRAPLPRTKPESPLPRLSVSGTVAIGDRRMELDGWPGMVGHNWGAEHAERWIWLHGTAFDGAPDAWLDLTVGRVRVGPLLTPWIANGAVSVDGVRTRVRGVATVRESPLSLELRAGGLRLQAASPREATVVWRYAPHHHAANCSVAALDVVLRNGRRLTTPHGGTYELGMREQPQGLTVQPFPDPVR